MPPVILCMRVQLRVCECFSNMYAHTLLIIIIVCALTMCQVLYYKATKVYATLKVAPLTVYSKISLCSCLPESES